jgi:hypothetical protein
MMGAFAYLLFNSTRNRLLSQLRRLRTPRYAIGFVLGIAYFWGFLGRNLLNRPRFPVGTPVTAAVGSPLETLAPAFVAIVIIGIWIFGGEMSALAFSEAEVSMLLTAPVPRRGLILYKLAQSQILILINVVIWTFILRRGSSTLPGPLAAASVWVMLTTLNLHRMGEALTRASNVEYRAAGKQKKRIAGIFFAVLFTAIVAMLVLEPLAALGSPDAKNPFAFLKSILQFFESPGVRTALYPFRLVIAPSFAKSASAWALAMLPALGIVLLHVWWVLRSDAAFEEAAAMASTAQAKRIEAIRSRRTTLQPPTSAGTRTIALAPTGWPVMAIVWKNAIALRRTIKPGALLRLPILAFGAAALFGWKAGDPALSIAITAFFMAVLLPLIAMQVLRNDLRSDMMHLPLLKSLPLAAADLVFAEIASGTVIMATSQFVLFAIAGIALAKSSGKLPAPAGILIGIYLALPVTLLALDGAICTLINGAAVLFPGWVRLGPGGAGGVEMMGQAMLSMIASLLAFLLMLLIPGALAAGAWFLLKSVPTAAVLVACLLAAAVLGAEIYVMIQLLGAAFERAEPQQIT